MKNRPLSPVLLAAFLSLLLLLAGCGEGDFHQLWHDVTLPSGKVIKVTSFHLVWGIEHDERTPGKDCFAMEFVCAQPQAADAAREQEVREVFELMRPISEQWGIATAELSGFPTTERKGHYDLYVFKRGTDGKWTFERTPRKVFANE